MHEPKLTVVLLPTQEDWDTFLSWAYRVGKYHCSDQTKDEEKWQSYQEESAMCVHASTKQVRRASAAWYLERSYRYLPPLTLAEFLRSQVCTLDEPLFTIPF